MNLNSIGYFQFNNLIQSRVPMILLLLDQVDLKPWFNSIIRMHLENIAIHCKTSEVFKILSDKNTAKNFAIIVLDLHGKESVVVAQELEKAGYINTYYVQGGFIGISKERTP